MDTWIKQFHHSLQEEDFITAWQQEYSIRTQLRSSELHQHTVIEDEEDFYFLKRTLYFGENRALFFQLLMNQLNSHAVINGLNQSRQLKTDFLHFFSQQLSRHPIQTAQLQGLISLYQDQLRDSFAELLQQLDESSCNYLMKRTGNSQLRALLKERIHQCQQNTRAEDTASDSPSTFSSRITVALRAVQHAEIDPAPARTIKAAEALLQAGMTEDCLLVLAELYPAIMPELETETYRDFEKLLYKAAPVYALMKQPFYAHECLESLMQIYFPGCRVDFEDLRLLNTYTAIISELHIPDQQLLPLLAEQRKENLASDQIPVHHPTRYLEETLSLLPGAPHKAFIRLELFRYFLHAQSMNCSSEQLQLWAHGYIELFQWFGHHIFLNKDIFAYVKPSSLPLQSYANFPESWGSNQQSSPGAIREKMGVFR
ncbi:MAG TPA: DUF885 domain-containing protein [Syntrophomonadaceae bacterium]|nr:DUF885 domain-containing protein [Syntrophomonadaceae bacterium]